MVQSAQMLFELLDSKIDEIGEDYVIQVVTDNASNYKLADRIWKESGRNGVFVPFWNTVEDFIRASKPLIVVLRIVDGDERAAMPEVYVAMEEAKKKIREHLAHKERLWKKIISIIDRRWECQMERPLYGAALFLNPEKFFMFKENENGELIANLHISLVDVMTRLVVDPAIQDKITLQIDDYRYSKGCFGRDMAIRQRTTINPITWWSTNGGRAFELSKLARRILGLYSYQKRNRLEHSRLNDLVYVQYNSCLHERFQQRQEDLVHPNDDLTWDDVGRAMGASIEAPIRPRRTQASTSRADVTYSRRGHARGRGSSRMADVQDDCELDEDEEEEEDDVNDDENVVDDYVGVEEPRQENRQMRIF
ncbi:uncharacterized protein LOC122645279 [Telopea speciosissima]|uniref:uncharacterized protein LOC122645279 n=1 Tax=Telopea speciosissima TaxID=54955 RepID=UPI001CC5168B|nr:uncharacterized protein LOC122645279 [Telopea speciosissima]